MKETTIIIPTPSKLEIAGKRTHSEAIETEKENSEKTQMEKD